MGNEATTGAAGSRAFAEIGRWGALYYAANQTSFGGRTYNSLQQLTQVGSLSYNYSANQNNGQITSVHDAASGETITYAYDALKRLSSATAQNCSEQYGYDGFGNLTQMTPTGGAPSLSVSVDAATNRILPSRATYDNNGNMNPGLGTTLTYDSANRISQAQVSGNSAY